MTAGTGTGSSTPDAPEIALVSYDSCESALNGLRSAARPYIGSNGWNSGGYTDAMPRAPREANGSDSRAAAESSPGSTGSAPTDAPKHSTTNTHEAGVDEPDLTKTDGRRLISVVDGKLRVLDVRGRTVTATVPLPEGGQHQLLVQGDRALVVTKQPMYRAEPAIRGVPDARPMPTPVQGSTLTLIDLAGTPKTIGTLKLDGSYVDARQVGSTARVVVRSTPRIPFTRPASGKSRAEAERENQGILDRSTIQDWLPRYELEAGVDRRQGQLVECANIKHAKEFTGKSMLTVLSVDLTKELGTGEPVSVAGDGETVYATGTNLYVADDRAGTTIMPRGGVPGMPTPMPPREQRVDVHQFDIGKPGKPDYVGSGSVEGRLLNQYSLSEHDGNLRVATTTGQPSARSGSGSESRVTVLRRNGSTLGEIGKVTGLGPGERIYAVRFFGPVGYVVTFRQTDPLYTLDLSNPTKPRTVGELKIPGYSAYLHAAGPGKLIGVGQDATTEGRRLGTQVSLFDVANPADPKLLNAHKLAGTTSEVERDAHAFLYWPEDGLLVVPVRGYGSRSGEQPVNGALVLRLSGNGFTEVGTIEHQARASSTSYYGEQIRRAIVIGNELWTVSAAGAMVSGKDRVAQQGWVPFA
ncbi:beta-propeller domain-containing protein [Herbihabitans rhizosphaerae]|uniref:beta-propeller domain-containing protein n=1 Tax=Herbihabitans rhizosphaerae TaxID=1872711 RepID=UPI0013EE8BAD|nr:beta-propeller domain-containing protein [Herbihabitans rhizosphaerae]